MWQNHGGTLARVLGTAPLAPDGSFYLEVPADRLLHLQVLDSDRRVVGNQLTWIYPRPGETKSCVGCHEDPHGTSAGRDPLASHFPPLSMLPRADDFRYRAKAWIKGHLPAQVEEQTRTVRAVNLLGAARYPNSLADPERVAASVVTPAGSRKEHGRKECCGEYIPSVLGSRRKSIGVL